MDLADAVPVSRAKVAAAWQDHGPDQVLATLRAMGTGAADSGAA